MTTTISPLRQRMIEDMTGRKLSTATQKNYIRSCRRFAAFLGRSPESATTEDVRRFQLYLAQSGMSHSNRNRTMTGLRFLFRVTLRRLDLANEIYHVRHRRTTATRLSPVRRFHARRRCLRTRMPAEVQTTTRGHRQLMIGKTTSQDPRHRPRRNSAIGGARPEYRNRWLLSSSRPRPRHRWQRSNALDGLPGANQGTKPERPDADTNINAILKSP